MAMNEQTDATIQATAAQKAANFGSTDAILQATDANRAYTAGAKFMCSWGDATAAMLGKMCVFGNMNIDSIQKATTSTSQWTAATFGSTDSIIQATEANRNFTAGAKLMCDWGNAAAVTFGDMCVFGNNLGDTFKTTTEAVKSTVGAGAVVGVPGETAAAVTYETQGMSKNVITSFENMNSDTKSIIGDVVDVVGSGFNEIKVTTSETINTMLKNLQSAVNTSAAAINASIAGINSAIMSISGISVAGGGGTGGTGGGGGTGSSGGYTYTPPGSTIPINYPTNPNYDQPGAGTGGGGGGGGGYIDYPTNPNYDKPGAGVVNSSLTINNPTFQTPMDVKTVIKEYAYATNVAAGQAGFF
jgi:hypothetical protein